MSTLRERRSLRDLTVRLANGDANARRAQRHQTWWQNSIAANAIPLVATLALVWLATVSLVVVNYFVPFNLVTLMYMLPVVVAATQWGVVPGIVAAVAGAAAADFFFYPPLYTFWIRDPQDVIDLILFLLIALVTSNLAARLKNEAVNLRRREREIGELHAFSQGLATCLTSRDLIFAVQDYLSNALRYRAVLIATASDDHAPSGDAAVPEEIRRAAVKLIAADSSAGDTSRVSAVVDSPSGKTWLVRIIAPEILGYGAIAVELGEAPIEPTEEVAKKRRDIARRSDGDLQASQSERGHRASDDQLSDRNSARRACRRRIARTAHAARVDPGQLQRAQPDARRSPTIASRVPWSRQSAIRRVSSTTRFAICSTPPGSAPRASSANDVDRPDRYRRRCAQAKGAQVGFPLDQA